jgi:hypothetical protein
MWGQLLQDDTRLSALNKLVCQVFVPYNFYFYALGHVLHMSSNLFSCLPRYNEQILVKRFPAIIRSHDLRPRIVHTPCL